jgi:hypothetical protein
MNMKALPTLLRPLTLAAAATLLVVASGSASTRIKTSPGVRSQAEASYFGSIVLDSRSPFRLPRNSSSFLRVRVQRFNTDAEAQALAALLKKKGQDEVRSELGDRELGTVQFGDSLALPVAAAWRTKGPQGDHLTLIVPRHVSIREVFANRRSSDYPYTVVELDVAPDGRGQGEISGAARLRADKAGALHYEDLMPLPTRVLNVQPMSSSGAAASR